MVARQLLLRQSWGPEAVPCRPSEAGFGGRAERNCPCAVPHNTGLIRAEEPFMGCVEGWGEAAREKITVNTAIENKHNSNKAAPVKPGLEFSSQAFCCQCNSVQLVVQHLFLVHC